MLLKKRIIENNVSGIVIHNISPKRNKTPKKLFLKSKMMHAVMQGKGISLRIFLIVLFIGVLYIIII
jgi:hypothetical protein